MTATTYRWREVVYSDRVIVTQFDDGKTVWPEVGYRPTSSCSMPSAVLGMLDTLEVEEGMRVLEIGAGTGYNAALVRHEAPPFPCGDERSPPSSCRSRPMKPWAV